jgi:oligosaccharide repeat unit polymerase
MTGIEKNNPFVALPQTYRYLVLLYIAVYLLLLPVLKSVFFMNEVPNAELRLIAFLFLQLLTFLPLIFYRPQYGIMHPLIFPILIGTFFPLVRNPTDLFSLISPLPFFSETPAQGPIRTFQQGELFGLETVILLLKILAVIAMYAGFFLGPKIKAIHLPQALPKGLKTKVLFIVSISLLALLYYLSSKGGLTEHHSSMGGRRHEELAGEGIYFAFINFGYLATLVWFAYDKNAYKNPLFWLAVLITLPSQFLLRGSRSSIIFSALLLFLIYMLRSRKIPTFRLIGLAFGAILLVAILGEIRRSSFSGNETNWDILTQYDVGYFLEAYSEEIEDRSSKNPDVVVVAKGISDAGLLWGKTYLGALLFFVPRAIWPDKPHSAGYYVGNVLHNNQGAMPPGTVIEAYWNFHFLGVLLVYLLYGIFLRWLATFFLANKGNPASHLVFIILLFYFQPGNMGMVKSFQSLTALLIILWFIHVIPPRLKIGWIKI